MGIKIGNLNDYSNVQKAYSLSNNENESDNLRELSEDELKTSGGANAARTVIIADEDVDVYYIADRVPANFTYSAGKVNVNANGAHEINVDRNGDIDIKVFESDSSSSSSSS